MGRTDTLTLEEFMMKLASLSDEDAENWIIALETTLQSQNRILKNRDFYPFKWHFSRLKILLDSLTVPWAILARLIDITKPNRIGVSRGADPCQIHDLSLFFRPNESIYGMIASEMSRQRNVKCIVWEPSSNSIVFNRFSYFRMLFQSTIRHPQKILSLLRKKISYRGQQLFMWWNPKT